MAFQERLSKLRQDDDSNIIPLPQIQDIPSGDASLDDRPNDAKNRRQRLANALNRIDKATEGQDTDASLRESEAKKLRRIKAIRAEAKDRVKERIQKVRENQKDARDDDSGENQARKLIGRIVDAVTDESAAESRDEIDEDEQDSNSNPLLRERVKNQVKREINRRLQDRNEGCVPEDLDGDGIAEECPEEGSGNKNPRVNQQGQKEKQEQRGNGRK